MTLTYQQVVDFLHREARLLDDRLWDAWLECYAPSTVFWMPTWDDDDRIIADPEREIFLIYYAERQGLEDRVFRIKTERSGASMPEPRTNHHITNVEIVDEKKGVVEVRFNWQTLSHRYQKTQSFFGTSFYTIDCSGEHPLITRKKIVLKSDYIPQVIDIYHV